MTRIALTGLILALMFHSILATCSADDLWSKTRDLMANTPDYKMNYTYTGDEGTFYFSYIVQSSGSKIYTELLEGSARGKGTRILYDKAKDPENVLMDTGFLTLRRSLTARDIRGSSLYQPLFAQLVGDLLSPQPREVQKSDKGAIFLFGERGKSEDRLQVDLQGNPVGYRRFEAGKEIKKMEFRSIEWGSFPISWKK